MKNLLENSKKKKIKFKNKKRKNLKKNENY